MEAPAFGGREDRPAEPPVVQAPPERPRREDEDERQEGIGVVVPEDQAGLGGEGHEALVFEVALRGN